jgi:hypothetical protein
MTSALDGVRGQRHAPAALYPRERIPGTHWIEGWAALRAGLDTGTRGKILCPRRGFFQIVDVESIDLIFIIVLYNVAVSN